MAVSEQNLVLNMPFDEAAGSKKAYDYSHNRADGVLDGGAMFVAGKQGNCVQFDGTGKVEVEQSVLNLALPFSICSYVQVLESKNIISILLNYNGLNRYYEYKVGLVAGMWYNLVVTYNAGVVCIYLNGTLIERGVVSSEWGENWFFVIIMALKNWFLKATQSSASSMSTSIFSLVSFR